MHTRFIIHLAALTLLLVMQGYSQPSLKMTRSIASDSIAICVGDTVQLSSSLAGLLYYWDPTTGLSDDSITNPQAWPNVTTTYVLTALVIDPTKELVVNGDFESGNTSFTSEYTVNNANLYTEGQYAVSDNPGDFHSNWAACGDHTSGTGNMMIINGDSEDNVHVWETSITVEPNTLYAFSAWIQNIHLISTNSLGWPLLQFSISGNNLPGYLQTWDTTCVWYQFYTLWNSGANTSADISIVNKHLVKLGNDFALDDISFAPLVPYRDTVVVIVHEYPVVDLGEDLTVEYNGSVTLDAGNPGANFLWSTGETFNPITVSDITSPVTVGVSVEQYGCESYDEINIGVGCEIGVPTGFSPNGDAHNDLLNVLGTGFTDLDFMIFNRHGEMVFRTQDPGTGWDGTYQGKQQPVDVYMYLLKARCLTGGPVEQKGNITLLR
jgi:gliding motility-associated-like protein